VEEEEGVELHGLDKFALRGHQYSAGFHLLKPLSFLIRFQLMARPKTESEAAAAAGRKTLLRHV
jgi:hypothetical protein